MNWGRRQFVFLARQISAPSNSYTQVTGFEKQGSSSPSTSSSPSSHSSQHITVKQNQLKSAGIKVRSKETTDREKVKLRSPTNIPSRYSGSDRDVRRKLWWSRMKNNPQKLILPANSSRGVPWDCPHCACQNLAKASTCIKCRLPESFALHILPRIGDPSVFDPFDVLDVWGAVSKADRALSLGHVAMQPALLLLGDRLLHELPCLGAVDLLRVANGAASLRAELQAAHISSKICIALAKRARQLLGEPVHLSAYQSGVLLAALAALRPPRATHVTFFLINLIIACPHASLRPLRPPQAPTPTVIPTLCGTVVMPLLPRFRQSPITRVPRSLSGKSWRRSPACVWRLGSLG